MLSLDLVKPDHPLLRTVLEEFDFNKPPIDPCELATSMVDRLLNQKGLGLAANQVGLEHRVFAMRGEPENFVCFNPRIVTFSEEMVTLEEGCLTFPGLIIPITRSKHVRVRFQGPNSETFTRQFTGLTARIFQHEMEHLNGEFFFHSLSRLKLERAIKSASKRGFDHSGIIKYRK